MTFRPPATLAPRGFKAALLLALAVTAGCAASRSKIEYVFPPPPEKARVELIRAFRSEPDLDPSFLQRLINVLIPHDSQAAIQAPSALALSVDEKTLYVGCGTSARVIAVDLAGRSMSLFAAGDANAPASAFGVAVDAQENVYVSDRRAGSVKVYDRKGKFLRKIGQGRLEDPAAIAVDRPGQQLYVLNGTTKQKTDHRIEVFSLKGEHLRTIGKRGEGPGEFNFPSALTVGPDRKLYVADKLNFRVQIFDPEGKFLDQFGEIGRGMAGKFDKIRGMAFDAFGNFYIVDTMQGVEILNPKRRALMTFGGPPLTGAPYTVVIDSRNRIYVADFGTDRVLEFQLVNTTAEDSFAAEPAPADAPPATPPVLGTPEAKP
jgi:sugar lactone lactonase YvrE